MEYECTARDGTPLIMTEQMIDVVILSCITWFFFFKIIVIIKPPVLYSRRYNLLYSEVNLTIMNHRR